MTLVDVGQVVIFLGAVVGAATVLVKAPPCRWLVRTLVHDPIMDALRREIAEVVGECLDARPLTNGKGWKTVQAIAEQVGAEIPEQSDQGPADG
ncbi:MAG TPA: hypothetical protein VGX21_13280 [Methylomirabilota bacterium]|nr:hypothetical protein [Methylomirabilota bacterium]